MSGHPIYYPWQGRAPQPPSLPTHSFNPWQPRAHKLRPPASPPSPPPPRFPRGGSPTGAVEGFSPGSGGIAGVGGQDPPHTHTSWGEGRGACPPLLLPSLLRHLVSAAPGQSRAGGDLCCPLPRRAAHGGRCSAGLGTERHGRCPHSWVCGGKAGVPPAHGRSRCWVGFPASGLLRGRGVWCGVVWSSCGRRPTRGFLRQPRGAA